MIAIDAATHPGAKLQQRPNDKDAIGDAGAGEGLNKFNCCEGCRWAAKPQSFKQQARELIDELPDNADWKDLVYEVSIVQDIEEGLRDSAAGRVVGNNEVRTLFGLPGLPE